MRGAGSGALALLVLCVAARPFAVAIRADRDLIGFSERAGIGSNPDERRRRVDGVGGRAPGGTGGRAPSARHPSQEVLSWEPRIFLYRNLLTDEECDHLVDNAVPRLSRSGVVAEKGGDDISDIRTSSGMFFERGEDAVIRGVEHKLSNWSLIPVGHGEGLQVLRYGHGQEYKPHQDYFFHEAGIDNGGNRLATVLMYLSDVESGGETVFPNVQAPPSQTRAAGFSACAMDGLAVRPRKGDAVLFFTLRPDGMLDKGAMHGGCPVISGTKFAATKWFHVAHYADGYETAVAVKHVVFVPPPPPAPSWCKDELFECRSWAEGGECEDNAGFMVGRVGDPGRCLKSCGRCDLVVDHPPDERR